MIESTDASGIFLISTRQSPWIRHILTLLPMGYLYSMNDRQLTEVIAVLLKQKRPDLVCALQDNTPLFTEVGDAAKKQFPEVTGYELKKAITTSLRLKLKDSSELGINYIGKKLSFIPIRRGTGGKTQVFTVPPSKMNAAHLMKLIGDHLSRHKMPAAASVAAAFASVRR